MDNGVAIGIAAGIGIPALGLLYKFIPQRAAKETGVLKEMDFDRLDEKVQLYTRLGRVEDKQATQGTLLQDLRQDVKSDINLLFKKMDDLKDLVIERTEKET